LIETSRNLGPQQKRWKLTPTDQSKSTLMLIIAVYIAGFPIKPDVQELLDGLVELYGINRSEVDFSLGFEFRHYPRASSTSGTEVCSEGGGGGESYGMRMFKT
jgi:hypothetical protein